jgi:hypothetical protein
MGEVNKIDYKNPTTGKLCGQIVKLDTGEYVYESIRTSDHFMRKYNGFGLSTAIASDILFGKYQKYNIKRIIIVYLGEKYNEVWEGTLQQFNDKEPYISARSHGKSYRPDPS